MEELKITAQSHTEVYMTICLLYTFTISPRLDCKQVLTRLLNSTDCGGQRPSEDLSSDSGLGRAPWYLDKELAARAAWYQRGPFCGQSRVIYLLLLGTVYKVVYTSFDTIN